MGKLPTLPDITNLTSLPEVVRYVSQFMKGCADLIGGNLNFNDNFRAQIVDVVLTNAYQNTVNHNLKFIPSGYLLLSSDDYISLQKGTDPWTDTTISLQMSSTARTQVSVKLLII